MILNYFFHDRQAEACSAVFTFSMKSREHLEDLIRILLVEADTIVDYINTMVALSTFLMLACPDLDYRPNGCLTVFQSVADDVLEHLLQLTAITPDNRQRIHMYNCRFLLNHQFKVFQHNLKRNI